MFLNISVIEYNISFFWLVLSSFLVCAVFRLGGPDPQIIDCDHFHYKSFFGAFWAFKFFRFPVVFKYMILKFSDQKNLPGHVRRDLGPTSVIQKNGDISMFVELYRVFGL